MEAISSQVQSYEGYSSYRSAAQKTASGESSTAALPGTSEATTTQDNTSATKPSRQTTKAESSGSSATLDQEQQREVQKLKAIDRNVRAHEAAHMAAGGGLVRGGATYTYRKGPDGASYAVAGEVGIDTSPEKDPRATIRKMQQVKAAAMAPADPSAQDRAVAAEATSVEATAEAEARQEASSQNASGKSASPTSTSQPGTANSTLGQRAVDAYARSSEQPQTNRIYF